MRFGSVCSGIEAASVAWGPLGWKAAWLSEIEPFPSAVLAHHYPDVPNLGDMTTLPARIAAGEVEAPDVFCGGTPCQAFSVAGLRQSLDDARGNLSLTFCEIANAIDNVRSVRGLDPSIVFWENVPGVLSTKDNAFGCFLGALAGENEALVAPGGRWTNAGFIDGPQRAVAWRVLDAQYFGVAQRRRRVFVVASARDDFDPAAVLFEFDGLRRDTAPSREAGEAAAASTGGRIVGGVDYENNAHGADEPTGPLLKGSPTGGGRPLPAIITMAHGQGGAEIGFDRGPTLTCNHEAPIAAYPQPIALQDVTPREKAQNGKGWNDDGTAYTVDTHATQGVAQPIAFHPTQDPISSADMCHSIEANNNATAAVVQPAIGFQYDTTPKAREEGAYCLRREAGGEGACVMTPAMQVRRLTPVECERLQGFPDNYTAIPWRKKPASECPDGPRYKALGNSWAVPVVRWIGERIAKTA